MTIFIFLLLISLFVNLMANERGDAIDVSTSLDDDYLITIDKAGDILIRGDPQRLLKKPVSSKKSGILNKKKSIYVEI